MKILGFNITREGEQYRNVVEPIDTKQTKESIPLAKSYPRAELGDSGTRNTRGVIAEEYNSNLQGINGIRVYDEMRRSDGTVRAAVLVTTLPIRRASYFISPATDDTKDVEIAKFVEHALFEWMEESWDDIVRQALLMIPFGVMVFEKVYDLKEVDGKTWVTLKKLAPRMPRSIQQWELTDGTFGIQQQTQEAGISEIPGSKLVVLVNEKEGSNWWGNSMLRAAYKHWYYKNTFYRIDAIAFERQGLGIPLITMPVGYTESDERKAVTAASNLRANESAYMIIPPEYKAEFMDMKSNTTRDPKNSIDHHNKEILQSVLAQFLELGQTSSGGGSRALSQDHTDLFLNALESIANNLVDSFQKQLIKELVDLNFSDVKVYPKLDYNGITRVDVTGLTSAYKAMTEAGALRPIPEDEQYIRSAMGLAQNTQMDKEDEPEEKKEIKTVEKSADEVEEDDEDEGGETEKVKEASKEIEASEHKCGQHCTHGKREFKFDDGTGYMTWRKLTFSEQKVSFENIEDKMDTLQNQFEKDAKKLLDEAKTAYMTKLQSALDENDTVSISEIEIKFVKDYKALIKDFMKKAYEYGKTNAATEMGVTVPPNSSSTLASIDLIADTIAWKAAIDLETKAKTSAANALKKLSETKRSERYASVIQVVGMIDLALDGAIEKVVSNAAGLIINQAINNGRLDVFKRHENKIHALQRSEILDSDTCDFCLSMDGRIVGVNDSWASEDTFHTNCRGIWVEILKEEPELPEIDGIPDNLADYYGGEPNALIQPRTPIVRPDSPAKDEVERRKAEKDKKKKE